MKHAGSTLDRLTRGLLGCGVAAGPLFVTTFLLEGSRRTDYDPRRHPISSLAIGPSGWTQRANFWVAGGLYVAGAVGLWLDSAGRSPASPRTQVGPILISSVGVGLLGAGVWTTDPISGYPPGSDDATTRRTAGKLHDLFSAPVFLALPAATFVYAHAFARMGRWWWMGASIGAGLTQLATFVTAGVGFSQRPGLVDHAGTLQRACLAAGFGWLTALTARALSRRR
jgi:hypothetical protein